jgi:gluconolactonase
MSFFPAPPVIETVVFTRLPRRTVWADANRQGRLIDSFLEGPSFDRHGNLYVTDIP